MLLSVAVILVAVFSTSSPLYPLNPWDDANIFFTVGRAMKHGELLYRDIFDQKGPVLFLLHWLAADISESSFLGVYVLEVIGMYVFLWYSMRTARLFGNLEQAVVSACLAGLLMISSDFFFYGDSAEEFMLPFLAYSQFMMLHYAQRYVVPKWYESFGFGIGIALIAWVKFTVLAFYAGALPAMLYIAYRRGMLREMWHVVIFAIMGFTFLSLVIVGYFAYLGTLSEMYDSFFFANIFQYNSVSSNGEPQTWWFKACKLGVILLAVILIISQKVRRDNKTIIIASLVPMLACLALFTVQIYYFLILYVFMPLILSYLFRYVSIRKVYVVAAFVAIVATVTNFNFMSLVYGSLPYNVIEASDIINADKTKDNRVFSYSTHETDAYTLTGQLPPVKYFFISFLQRPEIRSEQIGAAQSGEFRYLIQKKDVPGVPDAFFRFPIPRMYRVIYDKEETFRYIFVIHPLYYLWTLGYPRSMMLKCGFNPNEMFRQRIVLYERI